MPLLPRSLLRRSRLEECGTTTPPSGLRRLVYPPLVALAGLSAVVILRSMDWAGATASSDDPFQSLSLLQPAASVEMEEPPPPFYVKDDAAIERDLACLRDGARAHIHFLHFRKAGGSTLMHGLIEVLKAKFGAGGFELGHSEGTSFDARCFAAGALVQVTSLRDPIDRIVSSYFFEGRQPQKNDRKNKKGHHIGPGDAPPPPVSFKEYVETTLANYQNATEATRLYHLWKVTDNNYIRTLTNRYRDDTRRPVDENNLALAKRILAGFDVVLLTDHLSDPIHQAYLQRALGVGLPRDGFTRRRSSQAVVEEHGLNAAEIIDADTLAFLRELNRHDLALYAFAQQLVAERVARTLAQPPAESGPDGVSCLSLPELPTATPKGVPFTEEKPRRPWWSLPLCMYPNAEAPLSSRVSSSSRRRRRRR